MLPSSPAPGAAAARGGQGRPCAGRRTEFARPRSRSRRHRTHPCLATRRCPRASGGRPGQRSARRGDGLEPGCRRRWSCRTPSCGRGRRPGSQNRGQSQNCGRSQSCGQSQSCRQNQGGGRSRSSVGGQPSGREWSNGRGLSSGQGVSIGPRQSRREDGSFADGETTGHGWRRGGNQETRDGRSQEGSGQGTGHGQWWGSARRPGRGRGTGDGRPRGSGRGTGDGRPRGSGRGTASGIQVRDALIRARLRGTAVIRFQGSPGTTKPRSLACRVPIAQPIRRSPARRQRQLRPRLENGARKG
jgi:hypothetical protein